METIDFISAFGKLPHDGRLRDRFTHDSGTLAEALNIRSADRAQFCALVRDDVEFQALVLLRKRFAAVAPAFPVTCSRLNADGFADFARFARTNVLLRENASIHERAAFADFLRREQPEFLCRFEANRALFAAGKMRVLLRLISAPSAGHPRNTRFQPPILQVFFRRFSGDCDEWRLTVC